MPFTPEEKPMDGDIIDRLRGLYPVGPMLPNGEPEFGWSKYDNLPPIQAEAADLIETLRLTMRQAYILTLGVEALTPELLEDLRELLSDEELIYRRDPRLSQAEAMLAKATAFAFEVPKTSRISHVEIRRTTKPGDPQSWSISNGSSVLSMEGDWEYEPSPSNRDEEFLARCRYPSCEAAFSVVKDHFARYPSGYQDYPEDYTAAVKP